MPSVNYSGRFVDLLIFQNSAPVGETKITLGFGVAGEVTTGIQKLVQSFALLFLTEQGSVLYAPTLGSEFVTAMRQGLIRDESDVESNFALAVESVRQTLDLAADEEDLPEDETFESAELQSFSLDKASSTLTLVVKVNSAAGSSRELFLPLPLAVV
jgi:hypothetical protein